MEADVNGGPPGPAPRVTAAPQVPAGTVVGGHFQVQSFMRAEGPSQVYRALDTAANIPVALRLMSTATLGAAAAQLEADLENARGVPHKNLCTILEIGHDGDRLF